MVNWLCKQYILFYFLASPEETTKNLKYLYNCSLIFCQLMKSLIVCEKI